MKLNELLANVKELTNSNWMLRDIRRINPNAAKDIQDVL